MKQQTVGAIIAFLLGSGGLVWKFKDDAQQKADNEIKANSILNEARITDIKTKCSYERDSLRINIMELRLSCGN